MDKENLAQPADGGAKDGGCSPMEHEVSRTSISHCFIDSEAGPATCRVCQCAESDKRGDAALDFLGITPPAQKPRKSNEELKSGSKDLLKSFESDPQTKNGRRDSGFVEFFSPSGEAFVCNTDVEMGFGQSPDMLVELGCSCKNDLALVHYACALKWFVNHGSTVCEICGDVAKNIKTSDFRKVVGSLKEYEALRERTANGELNTVHVQTGSGVDPDAVAAAAIHRQRLSEISLWFSTHHNDYTVVSQVVAEQRSVNAAEEVVPAGNSATKWAIEGTGILLATGLLTVTLAWLITPHIGKKTAKSGLHILLGGVCALAIVVFFRFFVLTRIWYGPARYWAILFVFWFLVFGIWASRTHSNNHST